MSEQIFVCVGAGVLQTYMIGEAREMGYAVAALDADPAAPGMAMADYPLVCSTYDDETAVALVKKLRRKGKRELAGVATCGADVSPTVAVLAEAFGLPGIPPWVAARTHNKLRVRDALERAGLGRYQPAWTMYCPSLLRQGATYAPLFGYPCVVKPPAQRASRGVSLVADAAALPGALAHGLAHAPERVLIVEEALAGTEHSVEMLFDAEGEVCWFNVVDRVFTYEDGVPIELGHVNPTRLPDAAVQAMWAMGAEAAAALGVGWGPFKMDVMQTPSGPKILECTTRLSGGFDCQETSPLTGRHPIRQLVRLATTQSPEPMEFPSGYAACAAVLPSIPCRPQSLPRLEDIPGVAADPAYRGHLSYRGHLWAASPGVPLPGRLAHNAQRPGYVFAWAETYGAAWDTASVISRELAALLEGQGGACGQ